jgi:hypoxanthine phosphoribosyltransferase
MPMDGWTLIFGVASIIGLGIAIWSTIILPFIKRNAKPMYNNVRNMIDPSNAQWHDVKRMSIDLAIDIKKIFSPQIILAIDAKSAIIAEMIRNKINEEIPIFVGTSLLRSNSLDSKFKPDIGNGEIYVHDDFNSLKFFRTDSWYVHIPGFISDFENKKILIVQDYARTGEIVEEIRSLLINKWHFEEENIHACYLYANKKLLHNKTLAYIYIGGLTTSEENLIFPWEVR